MANEIESVLIRKGIDELSSARRRCTRCRRTLLSGEQLHHFGSGRLLCDLCVARLPADQRKPTSSEQVRVSDRRLRIARRTS